LGKKKEKPLNDYVTDFFNFEKGDDFANENMAFAKQWYSFIYKLIINILTITKNYPMTRVSQN